MSEPSTHFISPTFTTAKLAPGTFDDRVDVYEDRIWTWHLEIAQELATRDRNSTMAALHLAVAFVEPFEVFQSGLSSAGRSKAFFKKGIMKILNIRKPEPTPVQLENLTEALYKQLRCGLFHAALPGVKLFVTSQVPAVTFGLDSSTEKVSHILLNPNYFVSAVVAAFRKYVARLRDPADSDHAVLTVNFERAWRIVHGDT